MEFDPVAGAVTVSGDGLPRVELRRTGGEADAHTPVGTRAADRLALTVDGAPAALALAKGRLTRRSYRVDVRCGDVRYRLVPDSFAGSRLLRDGRRLGSLECDGDGRVDASWHDTAKVLPLDVSVGHALAAGFGTGAQPMWMTATEIVADLLN
ncbi:hypothetical protein [Streptomyces melanogenes]|uniref:hypothetical protein n=1 Tax=Streptomyces melanogenes TaxID=67326 RepID=UPI00167EE0F4|nr:hypothetical protein [Streptomyces melanogenes]GGP34446.1 hypothetical protein GCM10010278_08270 [Streptomyces melanogenes]